MRNAELKELATRTAAHIEVEINVRAADHPVGRQKSGKMAQHDQMATTMFDQGVVFAYPDPARGSAAPTNSNGLPRRSRDLLEAQPSAWSPGRLVAAQNRSQPEV